MRNIVALFLGGLALFFLVFFLADATQTRTDELDANTETLIEFSVKTHHRFTPHAIVAESLWLTCFGIIIPPYKVAAPLAPTADKDHYQVLVRPALGRYGQRKLTGCLEDVILDHAQAKVELIKHS